MGNKVTTEEAIKVLKGCLEPENYHPLITNDATQVLEMAIEALEAKPKAKLNKEHVLGWDDVEKDLYTDEDRIFGISLDLFNNHTHFYIKYKDGSEMPIMTDNIYDAIDVFNGDKGLDLTTYRPV